MPTRPDSPASQGSMRAALLPGGVVVVDESGQVRLGLSEESVAGLVGQAPEHVRLAVAHLAARRAVEAGWIEPSEPDDDARDPQPDPASAERVRRHGALLRASVIRSATFVGPDLLRAGLRARRRGKVALPLVEPEHRSYVGPLLTPDSGPCVVCLQRAVAPNRKSERLPELSDGTLRRTGLSESDALRLMVEHAARMDEILEVHRDGRLVRTHRVRSFPDCPICGSGSVDPNARCPVLERRRKCVWTDTGARAGDPRETFESYRHLISPVSGAVRQIREVDMGAPDLIHVCTASHAMSERADTFAAFMRDGRDPSGGKGSSSAQARTSALCEALERFSAVAIGNEVDTMGRLEGVEGAIHPSAWLLFSERQYDGREEWNAAQSRLQYVPERFDLTEEIAWSRVWCLQTGSPAHLPTAALYFDFQGPGTSYCRADSNGLAAGANLEEAVLQGFLEVVERDAIALWWYNRLPMPALDAGTFGDTYVRDVLEYYDGLGRPAWVLDLTSDLGIPVFAAISARSGHGSPEIIFGFGAHLDPGIALRRCVTEMNQMLATVRRPPAERRRHLRGAHDDALQWWREATLEDNPYLLPNPELPPRGRPCFDHVWSDDLRDDIQTCLAVAGRHGLATYVRDMTRADLGVSVAKVVVPGLRHFWRRLAPGRLYDAPVAMGKLDAPLPEETMNPVSFFV